MSSSLNYNYMYNRLYLKNVPMEITKNQLKDIFFSDLENIDIHFPKNKLVPSDKKVAFIQFTTANEGKLARQVINKMEWRNVQANFATRSSSDGKTAVTSSLGVVDSDFIMETRRCAFCGSALAEFACGDCSTTYNATFYCSDIHQQKDWPRHRIECKPLPKLKRASECFKTVTQGDSAVCDAREVEVVEEEEVTAECESTRPRSKFCAPSIVCPTAPKKKFYITHVINNRTMYVRPVDTTAAYRQQLEEISMSSSKASQLQCEPEIQDYVLAPLHDGSCSYHRARVQDIFETDSDGCNVKVTFSDFGNEAKFKWTSLRRLNYRFRGMPTHIFRVVLEGVKIGVNSEQVTDYLRAVCSKNEELELVEMTSRSLGERLATFRHIKSDRIVNELVNELMCESLSKPQHDEKVFYDNESVPRINRTENVKLGIADSSQLEDKNYLACMPYELLSEYCDMLQSIQEYCRKAATTTTTESSLSYTPVFNEIYLVKYNDEWQRAINSKGKGVILIDKMVMVSISSCDGLEKRKIPLRFGKKLFTSLCFVERMSQSEKRKLLNVDHAYFNVSFDLHTKCTVLTEKI